MTKRDYFLLLTVAFLVRFLAAWPQQQPNYMDAAYYFTTGQNLAQGRGFVEDFAWNFLGEPQSLPQPSHLYWMPLTSLLAAAGMLLGGDNYRAAQLGFVLVSALLAPISAYVAASLGGRRWQGWLAGLLAVFSGFYFPFWTAIDNFALFGVLGSLALLLTGQEYATGPKANGENNNSKFKTQNSKLFFAGVLVGLAHLTRADGLLLLVAIELYLGWRLWRTMQYAPRTTRLVAFPILGYLLAMVPWFVRNLNVAGALLPVAGSQTMWLTGYDDLFSYGRVHSAATLFAHGLGPVLAGRWWAFTANLQTVLAVWGMIVVLPLAVVGCWYLRQHGLVQLNALYGLSLFAALTLVFAFPGARGGLFHSGAALLPFIYGTAAIGLDVAVTWMARRRRNWHANSARQVFATGLLLLAISLSGFVYYQQVLRDNRWNRADAVYPEIAAWVAAQQPGAVVMIGNPPAYRYHGGGLSVVVPNEPLDTVLQAARQYGVRYLVLDKNRPATLAGVFDQPESAAGLSVVQRFGDVIVFRVDR